MSFTRPVILFRYNNNATRLAFWAILESYQAYGHQFPVQLSRNLSGTLLVARGATKRRFEVEVLADNAATGGYSYGGQTYNYGKPVDLKNLLAANDCQCLSFEDSAFWNCLVFAPLVEMLYDPLGRMTSTRIMVIEK